MPEDFQSDNFETLNTAPPSSGDALTTTDAEAASEEAPELVTPEEGTATESAETQEEEVPFHQHPRWQQVQKEREELKVRIADLEPFQEIIQGFKEQGFTDAAAIRAAVEQAQADASTKQQETALQTRRDTLAWHLKARAEDPDDEMTPGEAEAVFRASQLEWDLDAREQSGAQGRIDAQASALAVTYPQMDKETVADLLAAGKPDRAEAAAKRSHEMAAKISEQAVARYNADKAKAPRPVEGSGGGVAGARNIQNMSAEEFLEYDRQLVQLAQRG
jgi:hypothetical protein